MTRAAQVGGRHARQVLAAQAVTARRVARPEYLRVINDLDLRPGRGRHQVAGVAYIRRANRDMSRRQTVATRRGAGSQHFGVVHGERIPRRRGVARATVVGGTDMRRALATRKRTVVARRTNRDRGLQVVECQDRLPSRGELAVACIA